MPKVPIQTKSIDLLPNNPKPELIECSDTMVRVNVTIETDKPISAAKKDLWTQVAENEVLRYKKIVGDTVKKKVSDWDHTPLAQRKREGEELAKSINAAYRTMEAAVQVAVKEKIKSQAQGDQNLLEAQVHAVADGVFKVIAIGKDVAEVVATGATDVKAWYDLVKDVVGAVKLVNDQFKGEAALRSDLLKAIGQYCSAKQRHWAEAHKQPNWKSRIKEFVNKIWNEVDDLAKKAEAQRKKYRNELTAMEHKVEDVGVKRDKLLAALRKSGRLDAKGLANGMQMIELGKKVTSMNKFILDSQVFADDMANLLTLNGIDVDDRTFMEKMKGLNNLSDIQAEGKAALNAAGDLYKLIDKIKG